MPIYRLTQEAELDLLRVGRQTQKTWGIRQRNRYLKALDERFAWLVENPFLGKVRDDVRGGYRSYQEGKHVVFYIIDGENIDVIGVLHEKMDFGRHL